MHLHVDKLDTKEDTCLIKNPIIILLKNLDTRILKDIVISDLWLQNCAIKIKKNNLAEKL